MIPVILSGGSGTRLWPLSRSQYPKQFLPLVTDNTMLQETLVRLDGLQGITAPIVVCNEDHRFMVAEQLREMGVTAQAIMLEPVGRNTAPAVAWLPWRPNHRMNCCWCWLLIMSSWIRRLFMRRLPGRPRRRRQIGW